jgi:hypothetical protein
MFSNPGPDGTKTLHRPSLFVELIHHESFETVLNWIDVSEPREPWVHAWYRDDITRVNNESQLIILLLGDS